jgi:hypothetical protein
MIPNQQHYSKRDRAVTSIIPKWRTLEKFNSYLWVAPSLPKKSDTHGILCYISTINWWLHRGEEWPARFEEVIMFYFQVSILTVVFIMDDDDASWLLSSFIFNCISPSSFKCRWQELKESVTSKSEDGLKEGWCMRAATYFRQLQC